STLFGADVPLLLALQALRREQSHPRLRDALEEIASDVDGGMSFSKALTKHPDVFSPFFVNLVRSGEVSGKLQEVLSYLADYLEREYEITSKARGALIYPAFVLTGFLIVAIVMVVYVIPQLEGVLTETGQEFPLVTRVLLASSRFFRAFWWLLGILAAGGGYGLFRYLKTPTGRALWDRLKLRLPVLGPIARELYMARFAESLATLIVGGLPITEALGVSADVVGNEVYRGIIREAVTEVRRGETISSVLRRSPEVPAMVAEMVAIGEQSGRIDAILRKIAAFYQRDVDRALSNLVALIEPVLIVGLGIGVGLLVAAVLLPIYNLTRGI
ncbi:type II secretion system F family protein, partial [Candidatus Azambacteria bacterium]|nr:type II secretion system F family protein [Candidatus Azambacteria bacterium]